MKVFKNKNYTKRDYEATNVIACISETPPNENWIEADEAILNGLNQLWTENNIKFFGYL